MLGFFNFLFINIAADGDAKLLLKKPRQIAGGQAGIVCKLFDGNAAFQVALNIVHTADNGF